MANGAELIALSGGFDVAGAATGNSSQSPNAGVHVASSTGAPGFPAPGTPVLLAQGAIRVSRRSSGVVLILAKSRTDGGRGSVASGTQSLWIELDGRRVGATVSNPADGGSQRTIATSFLTAGRARLSPGVHSVAAYTQASGSFEHAYGWNDLPLVWFD